MELGQGIFAVKLYELEREYGQMCSRLQICQHQPHDRIVREKQSLEEEWKEADLLLQKNVETAHLASAAELAEAQLDYRRRVEQSLGRAEEEQPGPEERAEAAALYAEYAIDFATQSMRHALLAAMEAIDLQMTCEERRQDGN